MQWKLRVDIITIKSHVKEYEHTCMIQSVCHKPFLIESFNAFDLSLMVTYFLSINSQCSKTCGRGLRKRSVFCSSTDPGAKAVVVPDSMCRQHHRPKAQETCVLRRCPKNERLQWIPTPWGEVGEQRHETGGAEPIEVKLFFWLSILKHFKSFQRNSFWWRTSYFWVHCVAWWCVCFTRNVEDNTWLWKIPSAFKNCCLIWINIKLWFQSLNI